MGIIVQKFGGTSVATPERLLNVCNHIKKELEQSNKLIVVVSAQGKTTDKLIAEEFELDSNPNVREHDVLLSVGEQITIAKLCILLNKLNIPSVSLTGWQIPIVTDSNYTDAKIKYIGKERILKEISANKVVVVAGFQGIDENQNITTLRKRWF